MKSARSLFPGIQPWRRQAQRIQADEGPPTTLTATEKQATFIEAIVSGLYKFLAIGGGIRGTKTFGCLMALIILCRIYPRSRWAVVRRDLPTLRRNVIPTMEKLRVMSGGFVGPLNQSVWSYPCANGSVILLFPEQFSQDPELERWKGLEVNGFDLEEASELAEKSGNKAIERAGSYVIPATVEDPEPKQPPPIILANFNPCKEWPRKWWYEPWKAGTLKEPYYFLPVTIADNPFATDDYKESLTHLPPDEYNRFVKGEWDFVDDPNQLIKSEWIWAAQNVQPVYGVRKLGCDVARYGDDACVIAKIDGNALVKMDIYRQLSINEFGSLILKAATEEDVIADNVNVDAVGLGAGTVDYCRDKKLKVRDFISGATPIARRGERTVFKFKNLRSQAYWEFREKLRQGLFCLEHVTDRLLSDLATPRYEITADKTVLVESKDDIKQRLGRSPDEGDAVVMGAFDMGPRSSVFVA